MNDSRESRNDCSTAPASCDRYSVALDAALLILEDVDTLPHSNRPVRLSKVLFIVLDAIYEAERQLQGVQRES